MQQPRCKLFILDDNLEDRTVIRIMLEEAGGRDWEFLEEEKGKRALDRLDTEEPDCILLDYQLPDINGVRFLEQLVRRYGALRFPVVMLTGSGRATVAVNAIKAGAQDYLSKDLIRTERLLQAIENAMARIELLREQERQRAELERTVTRLRLLEAAVEATNESILITDDRLEAPGPIIVFCNRAFKVMTGYTSDDVLGRSPRILQGIRTDRAVLDRLKDDLLSGRSFSGQTFNYRKDGTEFLIEWSVAPVLGTDGVATHYVAVQRQAPSQALAATSHSQRGVPAPEDERT